MTKKSAGNFLVISILVLVSLSILVFSGFYMIFSEFTVILPLLVLCTIWMSITVNALKLSLKKHNHFLLIVIGFLFVATTIFLSQWGLLIEFLLYPIIFTVLYFGGILLLYLDKKG